MKYRDTNQRIVESKHYCGTCKSIASQYSLKSRALLNFDIVFLVEILEMISKNKMSKDFEDKVTEFNCFSIPREIPDHYKYGASLNLFLSRVKFKDNVMDNELPWFFDILSRLFRGDFTSSDKTLKAYSLDTENMFEEYRDYSRREKFIQKKGHCDLLDYEWLMQPLDRMCATCFAVGARIAGREDCFKLLGDIGAQFSRVVFLSDAIVDYPSDIKKGRFSLVACLEGIRDARELLSGERDKLLGCIDGLPIRYVDKGYLKQSIMVSLSRRMQGNPKLKNYHKKGSRKFLRIKFFLSVLKENKSMNVSTVFSVLPLMFLLPLEVLAQGIDTFQAAKRVPCCCAPLFCCCALCDDE